MLEQKIHYNHSKYMKYLDINLAKYWEDLYAKKITI